MVRVAIVGAGNIAKRHVESLLQIEDAKIVSIYDINWQRAAELAASCGAKACPDLDACIKSADCVYILTPPSFHMDIAIRSMEAGKHVMIEKPIAISVEEAEAIAETAKKYKRKAMVGFNMRYRIGYNRLKEMLDSGKLGEVLFYWSQRMGMGSRDGTWRTIPEQLSGFTIESLSHDIDMFRYLSGSEVKFVYGDVKNSRIDLPNYDDNTLAVLKLSNGHSAIIQASWSSHLEFNNRGIAGMDGTAMISGIGTWNFDKLVYKTKEMDREVEEAIEDPLDGQSYLKQNVHFMDCILHDKEPQATVHDGVAVLKVSHAILRANRENRVIEL